MMHVGKDVSEPRYLRDGGRLKRSKKESRREREKERRSRSSDSKDFLRSPKKVRARYPDP